MYNAFTCYVLVLKIERGTQTLLVVILVLIHTFMIIVVVQSLSYVQLFCNPTDGSPSGSSSIGFSRYEYWRGLPFPSPGNLPNPRIRPALAGKFFITEPPGKPTFIVMTVLKEEKKYSQQLTCPITHLIVCPQIYLQYHPPLLLSIQFQKCLVQGKSLPSEYQLIFL